MKKLYPLTVLMLLFSLIQAQKAEITGFIKDKDTDEPLFGASVAVKDGRGAISNAEGAFLFTVDPGKYTVRVSYIGYEKFKEEIEVSAGEKKVLNIKLVSASTQLNQVISVSQYKKNAAKETVSIDVIQKDQIRNTNSNTLGEMISKSPGVIVQDDQISIRGGSSYSYGVGTRTAVLVDNVGMVSADLGTAQNKLVPAENVKQVEVIKGASSVIYGSSALNGVVNVITDWPSQLEPQTTIETNFGFYDAPLRKEQKWWDADIPAFTVINAIHQRKIKNVQLVAGGNFTAMKSYLESNDEMRGRFYFKTRYLHPKIEGLNFGLNGSLMSENSERFFISVDHDSNAYRMAQGSDDKYINTTLDPHFTYQTPTGHRLWIQSRYMHNFRFGGGADVNASSHNFSLNPQYQYKFKNLLIVTAGLPASFASSVSNLYEGTRINYNAAAYLQAEVNYKFLSAQAGIRYELTGVDKFREFSKPVFRSGINLQAAKGTFFRASWGQSYRIPSIGERFIAQEFTAGIVIVPNDTLKTEEGWSLELGVKQGFQVKNWRGYIDASFFWQEYKNFVEYSLGAWPNYWSDGRVIFPDSLEFGFPGSRQVLGLKPQNVENARLGGLEFTFASMGNIGPVSLTALLGYTYSYPVNLSDSTTDQSVGTFLKGMFSSFRRYQTDSWEAQKLLLYRIRHLFRADFEVTWKKYSVGATMYYGSFPERVPALFYLAMSLIDGGNGSFPRYIKDHEKGDFIVDMRMGYQVNQKFRIGFIAKNITNKFYMLRPGKPEPTRNFTLQLRYTF
jgi:iron complex outermembrane receptor protein